jgi:hypothetical protein
LNFSNAVRSAIFTFHSQSNIPRTGCQVAVFQYLPIIIMEMGNVVLDEKSSLLPPPKMLSGFRCRLFLQRDATALRHP